MILKKIYLQISDEKKIRYVKEKNEKLREKESLFTSNFSFKIMSLCEYINRAVLKPLKFKTTFSSIVIQLSDEIEKNIYINSSNVLVKDILFSRKEIELLQEKSDYNEFFIETLTSGLKKTNDTVKIPLDELLLGMEEFRKNGYENKWTFKTRQSRELGIKCRLNCELTLENFHLNLQIEKKGKKIIFDKEILKTDPDSLAYHYKFKDIVFDDDYIKVVDDTYGKGMEAYIEEQNKIFEGYRKPSPVDGVLFKLNIKELNLHQGRKE